MHHHLRLVSIAIVVVLSAFDASASDSSITAFNGAVCTATITIAPVPLEACFEEFLRSDVRDPRAWQNFLKVNRDRMHYNRELGQFRLHAERPTEMPYSRRGTDAAKEAPLDVREPTQAIEVPYLSSGGWINVLTFKPSLEGHYDVTMRVLRGDPFKFDYRPQMIAADASQDPDFYAWKLDAAHAQTPVASDGHLSNPIDWPSGGVAVESFAGWLVKNVQEVRSRCTRGEINYALFFLGYVLHGIQDLAAHDGRTAAEHAWNSYCSKDGCGGAISKDGDPDENPIAIRNAYAYSERLLMQVESFVGDTCWRNMRRYAGDGLTMEEKRQVLQIEAQWPWDLSWSEYQTYKAFGPMFAKLADRDMHIVRWTGGRSDRFEEILAMFWRRLHE